MKLVTEIENGKLRKNNVPATCGGYKRQASRQNRYFHILTNV